MGTDSPVGCGHEWSPITNLPPPMACTPFPNFTVPDPVARHPYRAGKGGSHISSGNPDILDAIPGPIARLPDIARCRRSGERLDHWRGRPDPDDDACNTCRGREHQGHHTEKWKYYLPVH